MHHGSKMSWMQQASIFCFRVAACTGPTFTTSTVPGLSYVARAPAATPQKCRTPGLSKTPCKNMQKLLSGCLISARARGEPCHFQHVPTSATKLNENSRIVVHSDKTLYETLKLSTKRRCGREPLVSVQLHLSVRQANDGTLPCFRKGSQLRGQDCIWILGA